MSVFTIFKVLVKQHNYVKWWKQHYVEIVPTKSCGLEKYVLLVTAKFVAENFMMYFVLKLTERPATA